MCTEADRTSWLVCALGPFINSRRGAVESYPKNLDSRLNAKSPSIPPFFAQPNQSDSKQMGALTVRNVGMCRGSEGRKVAILEHFLAGAEWFVP